jgi:hypothetical protein
MESEGHGLIEACSAHYVYHVGLNLLRARANSQSVPVSEALGLLDSGQSPRDLPSQVACQE